MATEPFIVPTDAVTLHRWGPGFDWDRWWGWRSADGSGPATDGLGEQIGDPIFVDDNELRRLTFPPHRGERAWMHAVTWHDGLPMSYHGPLELFDGDSFSLQVPITATVC
jgi:hypothetical protein